jgi:4-hydroxyphenylpyruvate dioxygenase
MRATPTRRRWSAGRIAVREPRVLRDDDGEVVIAAIRTYGDTIHSLVERRNYRGSSSRAFVPVTPRYQGRQVGLQYVDHCVGNVELGKMNAGSASTPT